MSNLVISRVCNLSCPYCFAEGFMQSTRQANSQCFITRANFLERLDFLQRSGIHDLRLIGGEPTLHPQISELIELGRQRGMQILIFTHGFLKEPVIEYLETLPEQECTLLVNMNARAGNERLNREVEERRQMVMSRLRHLAMAGFNIYMSGFDLTPVMDTIIQTGCRRVIRLGLAHPMLAGENKHLHPKQYSHVAGRIVHFAKIAAKDGIHFEFDCGFVRCMFSDAELAILKQSGSKVHFECSPILDVELNNEAYHCFPLADRYSVRIDPGASASDLRNRLAQETQLYRMAGIHPTCSTCGYKANKECSGGCLSATIRRFRPADITVASTDVVMTH